MTASLAVQYGKLATLTRPALLPSRQVHGVGVPWDLLCQSVASHDVKVGSGRPHLQRTMQHTGAETEGQGAESQISVTVSMYLAESPDHLRQCAIA